MRHSGFRWFFFTNVVAMMADNIEHVISYWVMFQKFHSPALGGFAVLSHWLPFLFFSIPVGSLADRFDPRRLVQIGMAMFMAVSLCWGLLFATGTLQMWEAMLLLVVHGFAALFWNTSNQMLLYGLVPPEDLRSAVRSNASARYLGVLAGPAVGGAMLLALGPTAGILLNATYYLPLALWLIVAPRPPVASVVRAVRSLSDIARAIVEVAREPTTLTMILLAGAAAAFIGNSYQAQMPNFAQDLGHGHPGSAYSMLLAADAAGAIGAAILLESFSATLRPRTALLFALGWCAALAGFALTRSYPVALICLFAAGFLELSFSSLAQTIVQLRAPEAIRGRVIGLYVMASLGGRAFAGITVGILGALVGVHLSLPLAAAGLAIVVVLLLAKAPRDA
jgi:MFS family permease